LHETRWLTNLTRFHTLCSIGGAFYPRHADNKVGRGSSRNTCTKKWNIAATRIDKAPPCFPPHPSLLACLPVCLPLSFFLPFVRVARLVRRHAGGKFQRKGGKRKKKKRGRGGGEGKRRTERENEKEKERRPYSSASLAFELWPVPRASVPISLTRFPIFRPRNRSLRCISVESVLFPPLSPSPSPLPGPPLPGRRKRQIFHARSWKLLLQREIHLHVNARKVSCARWFPGFKISRSIPAHRG